MGKIASSGAAKGAAVLVAAVAMVLMAALMATPAWASSPSAASVKFYKYNPECGCAQEVQTTKASEKVGYGVSFTATSALSGGATANDSITISAPAGTVFPAGNEYSITNDTTNYGYSVLGSVTRSNGGATVTIPLAGNNTIAIGAGDRVSVTIGLFGPEFVQNPSEEGEYTLDVWTSRDITPTTSTPYTLTAPDPPPPDATPPTVVSVSPLEGAKGVPRSAPITATFSEEIATNTLIVGTTVYLEKVTPGKRGTAPTYTQVPVGLFYDTGTDELRLYPQAALERRTTYRVTITEVEDLAGNALAQAKVWNFTTGSR